MLKHACIGLIGVSIGACWTQDAVAQTATKDWTIGLSLSGAQLDGEETPVSSASALSLERQFGTSRIGGELGAGQGSVYAPEFDGEADQDYVYAALWWGASAGEYDVTISLYASDQNLSGTGVFGDDAPSAIQGLDYVVDGDILSSSISATVGRSFGDTVSLTPSVTLSFDQSEADYSAALDGESQPRVSATQSVSGLTGVFALDASAPISDAVSFVAGGAYWVTDEPAAQGAWQTTRRTQIIDDPTEDGATQWGQAYAGVSLAASDRASISLSAGTTIGLDRDEAFADVSLSFSF